MLKIHSDRTINIVSQVRNSPYICITQPDLPPSFFPNQEVKLGCVIQRNMANTHHDFIPNTPGQLLIYEHRP